MKISKDMYKYELKGFVRKLRRVGFYDNNENFVPMVRKEDRREIIRNYFIKRKSSEAWAIAGAGLVLTLMFDNPRNIEYAIGTVLGAVLLTSNYQLYRARKLGRAINKISKFSDTSEDESYRDMRILWRAI